MNYLACILQSSCYTRYEVRALLISSAGGASARSDRIQKLPLLLGIGGLLQLLILDLWGEKECVRTHMVYCPKYVVYTPHVLPHGTASNCLFPVWSEKIKKEMLSFCVHSNLRLISFNNPEYHPLQVCSKIEMPSSLIFEPVAPVCLVVTRCWTVNIYIHPQISRYTHHCLC